MSLGGGRRRVRGADVPASDHDVARQREEVDPFFARSAPR